MRKNNIKLRNYKKTSKANKKSKQNKISSKSGGNSCTVDIQQNYGCNTKGLSTCIPNVNVEQYKCPCNYLPLDGTKQNIYPLSNNPQPGPPFGITTGGKKSYSKKSNRKSNRKTKRKTQKYNKKGGKNTYLSVNNDTSAYTRYGAPGDCCGPNWYYATIKAGKRKLKNKSKK